MGYTDNGTLSKKRVAQRSVMTLAARNKKKKENYPPDPVSERTYSVFTDKGDKLGGPV